MPFARPTLTQLRTQVLSDIASSDLPGADSLLRKAVLRVLAMCQAGLAHLHFGYIDYIAQQSVPFTATAEYGERWGNLVGITRKAETAATGTATLFGTNGTVIPVGTSLSRGDSVAYLSTALGVIVSGTVTVPVQAVQAGPGGNADAGTIVQLTAAIAGAISQGTIYAADGTPAESDSALRDRYLLQYRAPPHGGDLTDYIEWSLSMPAVTRAWCLPHQLGPGTVSVFVMTDGDTTTHGFPAGTTGVATLENRDVKATGDLLTLADLIYPLQPVTALIYCCRPISSPLDVIIKDMQMPPGGRDAIRAALADVFLRRANPLGGQIFPSEFEAGLSAIPGVGTFTLAYPSGPVSVPAGYIMTLGTLTMGAS